MKHAATLFTVMRYALYHKTNTCRLKIHRVYQKIIQKVYV